MYRVLKCILEEHRSKGHKGETSVSVSGEASDPAAKKSISEKMQSGLKALDNTQFLDKESGKIALNKKNNKNPTTKVLTAEEKLVDDFSKLIKKCHS